VGENNKNRAHHTPRSEEKMTIVKASINGAISSISKGINKLEAVIADASKSAEKAIAEIDAAIKRKDEAVADIERATRIKAKLEELIS